MTDYYDSPAYRRMRAQAEADERERQATAAAARREQERLKQAAEERHRARLLDARAQEQAAAEAQVDAALEPERVRLERQWLADHPGQTAAAFAKTAWPLLRANLVEQQRAARREALYEAAIARGGGRL